MIKASYSRHLAGFFDADTHSLCKNLMCYVCYMCFVCRHIKHIKHINIENTQTKNAVSEAFFIFAATQTGNRTGKSRFQFPQGVTMPNDPAWIPDQLTHCVNWVYSIDILIHVLILISIGLYFAL